jgi:hypothetical protein
MGMTKYYVRADGSYRGAFDGYTPKPEPIYSDEPDGDAIRVITGWTKPEKVYAVPDDIADLTEVDAPPADGRMVWRGGEWVWPDGKPVEPRPLDAQEFIDRFTDAELAAVLDSTDIGVRRWYAKALSVAGRIDLASPQTALGVEYLISKGILASDRKAGILA